MKFQRGMVFGVFDGLHEGHKYFLNEAAKQCAELVVVVVPDRAVEAIKLHQTMYDFAHRVSAISLLNPAFKVVSGDPVKWTWQVLEDYPPDCVLVGHDQNELERALQEKGIPTVRLASFRPEEYKSSILNRTA